MLCIIVFCFVLFVVVELPCFDVMVLRFALFCVFRFDLVFAVDLRCVAVI